MASEIVNWQKATDILNEHDMPTIEEARKLIPDQEEFIE
jgi:hypothetical protein